MIVEDDIPVLRDDVRALSILGIDLTWILAPCLSDTETQPFWLPYVLQYPGNVLFYHKLKNHNVIVNNVSLVKVNSNHKFILYNVPSVQGHPNGLASHAPKLPMFHLLKEI
ncbi:hypothetical protein AFCA_008213 [Aspergillus flavus]|nr:hypothetical protein AFCA_008213 [Aspergillus flavus]